MAGHYINTIEDQRTGRPVNGATVLVYNDGATISGNSVTSGTLATIFSDDGVTTINQTTSPITTASNGFFEFYTNQTRVVIAVLFNGVGTEVYNDVDILGGTVSSDVTALSVRVDAVEAVTQDPLIVDLAGLTDPNADRIVFWDDSAGGLDWLTVGSGLSVSGTSVAVNAGAGLEISSNSVALSNYILSFFFTTTPDASEVLFIHVAGAAFTIPANFTGALEDYVGTNPTASFALDVQKNGTTAGTITVATNGAITATTASGAAQSFAVGDRLTVVAPVTPDATAANMAFTILGDR